jgi:hypothetical protein
MIRFGSSIIDLTPILDYFASSTPASLAVDVFLIAGWSAFAYIFLEWGLTLLVDEYKENKATKDWKWVTLAIDVPMLNIQTPKAVEQMFSHLAGALDTPDIAAKYRKGHKQRWFSFEIISIEGYIQFVIRTEDTLRDLVEAALYAQYPDAEIVEIEDYTSTVPDKFPNDTHDMWAADFGLAEDQSIPLRSYTEFEHNISKDTVLKDPMGTFLESFSRIGIGEQMWFQIIIQPVNNDWKKKAIEKIDDLLGKKKQTKGNAVVDAISNAPISMVGMMNEQIFGPSESDMKNGGVETISTEKKMGDLTPGQKRVIEAIEDKIMKLGFKTKLRGMYIGAKNDFRPERGVQALVGAVNQYNIPSHNSLVPKFGVSASYFRAAKKSEQKKTMLMAAYKKRKANIGVKSANPYVLNIEELATIWHFPMSHVKTPLLQKSVDKKSEPPSGLPLESMSSIPFASQPGAGGLAADLDGSIGATLPGFVVDTGDEGYHPDQQFG